MKIHMRYICIRGLPTYTTWLFQVHEDGSMECISKEKGAIGQKLYTKRVNSNYANNITRMYKHKEGKFL